MANGNFRVIVVGGGPVGLTTAHTLSKAGIDFVVLERQPTIGEDTGASIIVQPHGLRVLSQVGLLDRILAIGDAAVRNRTHSPDGSHYRVPRVFSEFESFHGCSAHVIHRAYLIRALYDGLSEADRSRVLTNKVVTDITTDESGVTVRCADGTRHDGSVVVGADGTHSVVRRHMRTLALQAAPSAAAADVDEEEPFVSEYRMMWCSFPSQGEGEEHGGAGAAQDTHGDGRSVQFLTGGTRSWMFVYEQLPAPTRDRARYTADDVAAYAEKWGDLPVDSEGLRVRDMFAQRHHAGMTNLEEGVLRRWSWGGRLVLAGDAAHKFTPNAGLGYNNGIQDAAALTNELYRALHPSPYSDEKADEKRSSNNAAAAAAGPSAEVLGAAFERYQAVRRAAVESDFSASAFHTRTDAWRTTLHWLWDQWVLPRVPERLMLWVVRRLVGGSVARGVALDFLGGEEPFVGSIPWAHPIGGKSGSPSGGS